MQRYRQNPGLHLGWARRLPESAVQTSRHVAWIRSLAHLRLCSQCNCSRNGFPKRNAPRAGWRNGFHRRLRSAENVPNRLDWTGTRRVRIRHDGPIVYSYSTVVELTSIGLQ